MAEPTKLAGERLQQVLRCWQLEGVPCQAITAGHINLTFLVRAPGRPLILQRLRAIFAPEINYDLEAATARLAAAGLTTPRLVRAADGAAWVTDAAGECWRMLTYVAGQTVEQVDSPARAEQAGRVLGAFHRALWDWDYSFRFGRPGVHDTGAHLAQLAGVLDEQRAHPSYQQVAPLAEAILTRAAAASLPAGLPLRVVHGDPKITNVIFSAAGEALCLVDLDTLGRLPLPVELGDALRSWCAPLGEEREGPFDQQLCQAALAGYATQLGDRISLAERAAIPAAIETIALELAARFGRDALEERYFGWDPSRYPSASAHNLMRARSQLTLAEAVRAQRGALERAVAAIFPVGAF